MSIHYFIIALLTLLPTATFAAEPQQSVFVPLSGLYTRLKNKEDVALLRINEVSSVTEGKVKTVTMKGKVEEVICGDHSGTFEFHVRQWADKTNPLLRGTVMMMTDFKPGMLLVAGGWAGASPPTYAAVVPASEEKRIIEFMAETKTFFSKNEDEQMALCMKWLHEGNEAERLWWVASHIFSNEKLASSLKAPDAQRFLLRASDARFSSLNVTIVSGLTNHIPVYPEQMAQLIFSDVVDFALSGNQDFALRWVWPAVATLARSNPDLGKKVKLDDRQTKAIKQVRSRLDTPENRREFPQIDSQLKTILSVFAQPSKE